LRTNSYETSTSASTSISSSSTASPPRRTFFDHHQQSPSSGSAVSSKGAGGSGSGIAGGSEGGGEELAIARLSVALSPLKKRPQLGFRKRSGSRVRDWEGMREKEKALETEGLDLQFNGGMKSRLIGNQTGKTGLEMDSSQAESLGQDQGIKFKDSIISGNSEQVGEEKILGGFSFDLPKTSISPSDNLVSTPDPISRFLSIKTLNKPGGSLLAKSLIRKTGSKMMMRASTSSTGKDRLRNQRVKKSPTFSGFVIDFGLGREGSENQKEMNLDGEEEELIWFVCETVIQSYTS